MLALLFALPGELSAQAAGANPFRDVPRDHWAYDAIDKMVREGIMEGHPDGTFKGRKVVSRYDMAKTVAKLLARVTQIQASGSTLTPDNMLRIDRLTQEFKSELELLGVKIDFVEKRLDKVEKRTGALEAALSNVRIEGYYRLENTFVLHPFNYTNYLFDVSKNPFTGFTTPGLHPLGQEAFLRFIGTPFIAGQLFRNVETFVELRARITGPTLGNPRLEYKFSNPPIAGDNLDDFATNVVDEQRVQIDKAHFVSNAKLARVRAFSNESMTDLTDPGVLLTVDSFDPAPFSGVEANGSIKKFSYFGSVLKWMSLSPSPFPNGNNALDLSEFFNPLSREENDLYTLRFTYEPYRYRKCLKEKGPSSLILGTSYVEKAYSYDKRNNFNRVLAVDLTFAHEGKDERFDLTIEPEFSFGLDPELFEDEGAPNQDQAGNAFRLDSSYTYKGFRAALKGYTFSKWFRAHSGARQFVDHNLPPYRDNFRRKNNADDPFDPAESLIRLDAKWDLQHKVLTHLKNLSISILGEGKRWATNPHTPRYDDHRWAHRWYLQTISDWTDNTHVELLHEQQFHLPPNALGTDRLLAPVKPIMISKGLFDFKATKHTSIIGELEFIDDLNRDAIGPDGKHWSMERTKFQINSQTNKYLFLSGWAEQIRNAYWRKYVDANGNIIRPLSRNARRVARPTWNGLNIYNVGAESNLQMFRNKVGLKLWGQRESAHNDLDATMNGTTDVITSEVVFNWTRALKARYQYGFQDNNLVNRKDTFYVNNFAELLYAPSEKTELRLTYGYEYENPDDRFDDGPYLFFKGEKIIQLTAHTDF
ncbi:MAG: S-layer homology domain-containing protein [Candidatus Riflebacteria bacterium]|nr:S-layer homology domain-containing protein [Candidatus Riflebacteria bacterium]